MSLYGIPEDNQFHHSQTMLIVFSNTISLFSAFVLPSSNQFLKKETPKLNSLLPVSQHCSLSGLMHLSHFTKSAIHSAEYRRQKGSARLT